MEVSVLFWNLWYDNQLDGPRQSEKLLSKLSDIVETHQPNCIGLNEVLQHKDAASPFVLDFLKKLGYKHSYFAVASPINDEWLIGAAIVSKHPLIKPEPIVLGDDTPATRRGFPGQTVKSVAAHVRLPGGKTIGFVATHPIALRLYTVRVHYIHTKSLSDFVSAGPYATNTIIGGDFNEPMRFPRSFKKMHEATLHHKSGTFRNPTWRYNASQRTPIRANLDRLFWTKQGTLELKKFEIIATNVSDHRPLAAVFELS
jgi:endonuclease/exonuclease/phosphatase family metal-dependent hydrolase